mgnify:CR=1 FL=1
MMKRYMEGELAPDAPKKANDPMEFSGGYSGPKLGPDVEGKACLLYTSPSPRDSV